MWVDDGSFRRDAPPGKKKMFIEFHSIRFYRPYAYFCQHLKVGFVFVLRGWEAPMAIYRKVLKDQNGDLAERMRGDTFTKTRKGWQRQFNEEKRMEGCVQ